MALQHLPSCDLSQAVNGSFLPQLLACCLLSLPGVWLCVQGLGWGHGTESGLYPGPHTPSQGPRAAAREAGPAYGCRLWAKGLPSWSTGPRDLFLKTALLRLPLHLTSSLTTLCMPQLCSLWKHHQKAQTLNLSSALSHSMW